jgi:hypothetical protein
MEVILQVLEHFWNVETGNDDVETAFSHEERIRSRSLVAGVTAGTRNACIAH